LFQPHYSRVEKNAHEAETVSLFYFGFISGFATGFRETVTIVRELVTGGLKMRKNSRILTIF